MDRLETRELAQFVAVAEELHFGRAAERLGIAQPPLSRTIGRLERRIGVRLLERTSRRVALTPAGKVFLDEARKALRSVDTAVRRAQQAARPHRLTVAARPGTGAGLLAEVVRAYGRRPDAAEVEVVFTHDQAAALRDGTADLALMCGDGDLAGLRTAELAQEAPVALLPAGHRLAKRTAVTLADLRAEGVFTEHCPTVALDEIVDRVALGLLVVVTGDGVTGRLGGDVAAVPVADLPGSDLVLAWPEHAAAPARAAFVRAAREIAGTRAHQPRAS
ncbi:hypothetical protein Sme01_28840 [Sphaerisporangium melleum]|uniref:HTH lysR-type domain-containing protein n=1 Tax=Sphaerisporangium melleum TaxID=321316 RepID=A0A917VIY4_9ACTN|nr:LysR family transcriptional regulator [Sphaerisporangium melleum]GGK84438.1 hypothetical protein GCM10007964_28610 [Sphaerisporangium melleum]GII70408.1 hypothetical protein Sme01_28840 [Sphaerisporangium melleum]